MERAAPVVVVANPTAGRGRAGRRIGVAGSMLRELRVEHEVRVAGSAQEMESTCLDAAERGAEIVAVIGGDGTVSCAANGLRGTGAALAVLPAGTGDDFAGVIGARPFRSAVRLLADPKIVAIDLVRVRAGATERLFVNIAGAGFDSEVNETANAMTLNLGGTGTYVAALVKTLSRFTPARYDLTVDGEPLTLDAMLVVVGSGRSYGGGMKVLPDASSGRRRARRVYRGGTVQGRVPSSLPEGVHGSAHHSSEGSDGPRHQGDDRGEPGPAGVRRRRARRTAAGVLRSDAGRPAGRGRAGAKGIR